MNVCSFCTLPAERIIHRSQHGVIIRDGYPITPGHTLVIPHPSCNRSKSDTLAAKAHLHRWLEFVQSNADNLSQIGYDAGIMADEGSMDSVARWGYANAVAGGAQGWIKSAQYEPIDATYLNAWA